MFVGGWLNIINGMIIVQARCFGNLMRISFDLDDTVICHQPHIADEPNQVPAMLRWWLNEPLRKGTMHLFMQLRQQGHSIGVYTTSYRSKLYIKSLFRCYNLKLDFIINQHDHEKRFKGRLEKVASKMPQCFGIDFHIDDDKSLLANSSNYGFHMLRVLESDDFYSATVLEAVAEQRRHNAQFLL